MATKMSMAILFVVLTAVVHVTEAAEYVVGNATWSVPSSTTFYTTWAQQYNFSVGDTLVFNFATGAHDVATVSKAAYDACTLTNTLSLNTTGPFTFTLTSAGEQYFICTISNHCSSGQKLAIDVKASSSSPTPPGVLSPPPPPGAVSPPPPPPPSSSASSLAATFPLVLITIALTSFIKF
ncbi:umecyanin [Fagus crenata]